MAKKPVNKLGVMHHIGYGAGDAGGVLMLMVISYLERFSRNILGIDPLVSGSQQMMELITEGTTTATECPYCGSPAILPDRIDGGIRPEMVVPFIITKEQAQQAFEGYFKGKKLLPNIFKKDNQIARCASSSFRTGSLIVMQKATSSTMPKRNTPAARASGK